MGENENLAVAAGEALAKPHKLPLAAISFGVVLLGALAAYAFDAFGRKDDAHEPPPAPEGDREVVGVAMADMDAPTTREQKCGHLTLVVNGAKVEIDVYVDAEKYAAPNVESVMRRILRGISAD